MMTKNFLCILLLLGLFYYPALALDPSAVAGKGPKIRWMADLSKWQLKGDEGFRQAAGIGMNSFLAGIELYEAYQNRPEELKNMLKALGMKQWILHAGTLTFDLTDKPETLKYLEKIAEFGGKSGAGYLLFQTETRDSYPPGKAKLAKLALALDAVAEFAGKNGLKVLIGNSMHSICQTAEELEFTQLQCKNKKVELFLDIAYMAQSGSAPQDVIRRLGKKIAAIRMNDLTRPVKGFSGSNERNYRLEIPGNGNALQYAAILEALGKIRFKGMGILGNPSPDDKSGPIPAIQSGKGFLLKTGFRF
jgi:sugar phosphate isomerase/epimerase